MKGRGLKLTLLLIVSACASAATNGAEPGYTCQQLMVPVRDGVLLATDVYIPDGAQGPFPTLVRRTPYGKNGCREPEAIYFAKEGYAVVNQDERGRYDSRGEYYWYRIFANDGYDTIEWAAKQPWSSGKVGTLGTSFLCVNQYTTLPSRPPHLVAAFCTHGAANPYKYAFYQGGALQMIMPTWLLGQRELARPYPVPVPERGYSGNNTQWLQWYRSKQTRQLALGEAMLAEMMRDMVAHPYYDDYWRPFAADERLGEINVPVLHFAGLYDRYTLSQVRMFNGLQEQGGEGARGRQKLVLGPWVHGSHAIMPRVIGDLDFGPEAAIDYHALQKRWFDYHLKGIDNGIGREPPVRLFVMGENRWRDANEFPLPGTTHRDYYLRAGPSGSAESLNDGLLLTRAPAKNESPDSYSYDPLSPTPTIGGDHFTQPAGARDHRPVDRLSLTYTTPALKEDVEVIGIPKVELFASSSAVDTDWVVTIIDVHPDGYSQHLRQNLLRARFREGWERAHVLEPGEVYKFEIEMFPIANRFRKGHRIRITINSSSFPKWYPNGNTGREMDGEMQGVIAKNTIYHDEGRASRVILPVVPIR